MADEIEQMRRTLAALKRQTATYRRKAKELEAFLHPTPENEAVRARWVNRQTRQARISVLRSLERGWLDAAIAWCKAEVDVCRCEQEWCSLAMLQIAHNLT